MVRFSSIVITYFVIGAVMFGAGAIPWDQAGIGTYLMGDQLDLHNLGDEDDDSSVINHLENLGGPIGNVIGIVGGGIIAVWNFVERLIGFTFWPITVLLINDAPTRVVVLGGGSLTTAFVVSIVRTIRSSA